MSAFIFTEVKGSVKKLSALAEKLGFPYRPGDRVFRCRHGKEVTTRAYRTIYPGKKSKATIHVQRVRRSRAA